MKWKAYWCGLATLLFGASVFVNRRRHRQWNMWQVFGKSILDTSLVVGFSWLWPPLMISISITWLLSQWKIRGLKDMQIYVLASVAAGFVLSMLATWALEVIALLGIASIGDLSLKLLNFRRYWREADKSQLHVAAEF